MTADQLRPTGDRILVRPDPREKFSAGGLEIPDSVLAENPNYFSMTGVVVRVGDGLRDDTYRCTSCQIEGPRAKMDRCPLCGALQVLHEAGRPHAFDVQVGDRVLFNRFAGKQIEVEECVYLSDADADAMFADTVKAATFPARHVDFSQIHGVTYWRASALTHRAKPTRYLMMRESEVLGIVEGDHRILPGYEAAKWGKVTDGITGATGRITL